MAIDDKFISANISKDVVDQMNRPRRRKRRGPRPWDKKTTASQEHPTPEILKVSDESELDDKSVTLNDCANDAQSAHNNAISDTKLDFNEKLQSSPELHNSPEIDEAQSEGKDLPASVTDQSEQPEELTHNQRAIDAQLAHQNKSIQKNIQRTNDVQLTHGEPYQKTNERSISAHEMSSKISMKDSESSRVVKEVNSEDPIQKNIQRTNDVQTEDSKQPLSAHNQRTVNAQTDATLSKEVSYQSTISAQKLTEPKVGQKGNKHTNGAQSAYSQRSNNVQLAHNKRTDRVHSTLNQSTVERTSQRTINAHEELRSDYYVLSGQELKFLQLVFNKCLISGNLVSTPITNLEVATYLGSKKSSVRTVIKRVVDKGFLNRVESRSGKGGWTKFGMSSDLYQKLLLDKQTTSVADNSAHLEHNQRTTERTVERTNVSSSSSNLNNNTNTNYESDSELTGEWLEIITPDSLKEISFGKTQLMQLKRVGSLTPIEVQESLDAFAYDLEAGTVKSFGSKLSFLMGIMRKGNNYISEAYMSEVRQAMDRQKALREEKEKLKKEEIQERLSQKARQEYEKLSDEEKMELVPENNLAKVNSQVHERMVLAKLIEKMGS